MYYNLFYLLLKEFFIKIVVVYICLGVEKKIRLWILIRLIGEWVMLFYLFFLNIFRRFIVGFGD